MGQVVCFTSSYKVWLIKRRMPKGNCTDPHRRSVDLGSKFFLGLGRKLAEIGSSFMSFAVFS
jgi:hypothetical protein